MKDEGDGHVREWSGLRHAVLGYINVISACSSKRTHWRTRFEPILEMAIVARALGPGEDRATRVLIPVCAEEIALNTKDQPAFDAHSDIQS